MAQELLAVIDLGTNTFHLLILALGGGERYRLLARRRTPVRLGEGGINRRSIAPAAFERGIQCLAEYAALIQRWGVTRTIALATSAVRNAANGEEFVRLARLRTGLPVRMIQGDEEAYLIYQGIRHAVALPPERRSLLLDIGGGSTEFIVAQGDEEPALLRSINIGGARMLAFYGLPDPLTDEQAAGLRSYIRSELGELMAALRPLGPQLLIGASGTFETLAELVAHRRPARPIPEHFNGYEFTAAEFQEVLQALMQSTHQARLQMRGLATERVDMIVMGALLVEYVLTQTGIERIRVSESALKEGVIYTYGHTTVSEPG